MLKPFFRAVCFLGLAICQASGSESENVCHEEGCTSQSQSLLQTTNQMSVAQPGLREEEEAGEADTEPEGRPDDTGIQQIWGIFAELDTDGSGELELDELVQDFLQKVSQSNQTQHHNETGLAALREQIKKLIEPDDDDGNSALSLKEFMGEQHKEKDDPDPDDELASEPEEQEEHGSGGADEQEVEESELINASTMSDAQAHLSGETASISLAELESRRRKNQKQKKWAAKQMRKMEGEICSRDTYFLPQGKSRHVRTLDWYWSGITLKAHCSGWDQVGLLCYKPCVQQYGHGWHGVAERCWQGCRSGYINGRIGECHERCGAAQQLGHLPIECHGWMYCADSWNTCGSKAIDIASAFAQVAANLVPVGKMAMKAARLSSAAARKALIKKAMMKLAKKMLRKAKKNLVKYIKQKKKDITSDQINNIMEGGAEYLAAGALKTDVDIGGEVLNALDVIDPTGVSSVVNAFIEPGCKGSKLEDFPTDSLEHEGKGWSSCTWSYKGNYKAAHWDCTPTRHWGVESFEECQQICIDDHAENCKAIEFGYGECRTFTCSVRYYNYGNPWEVAHASGCPEPPSMECTWSDRGPNVAMRNACTRKRDWSNGIQSLDECKDKCQDDYGEHCKGVEWAQDTECRTFGGSGCSGLYSYSYSGNWYASLASGCPPVKDDEDDKNKKSRRRRRRQRRRRR